MELIKELALQIIAKINKIDLTFDLAAGAIALIALYFSIRARRNQERLAVETIRIARDNDVIKWSNETIDVLAEIEVLLRGAQHVEPKEFLAKRDEYLGKLSAGIDKGRLYFPNIDHKTYGIEKESAYQGHRQPILDCLVEVYDLVKDLEPGNAETLATARRQVIECKRAFVSEAQSAVEPRRRVLFLKKQRR